MRIAVGLFDEITTDEFGIDPQLFTWDTRGASFERAIAEAASIEPNMQAYRGKTLLFRSGSELPRSMTFNSAHVDAWLRHGAGRDLVEFRGPSVVAVACVRATDPFDAVAECLVFLRNDREGGEAFYSKASLGVAPLPAASFASFRAKIDARGIRAGDRLLSPADFGTFADIVEAVLMHTA